MVRSNAIRFALAGALALTAPVIGRTQTYPVKPITFVLPVPVGTIDLAARAYADGVSATIGQKVVISNVAGSGGILAAVQVKQSPPDGYTLFLGNAGTHSLLKSVKADLPYDPVEDFRPITLLFSVATYVTVPGNSPANSVAELIAFARTKPGKLNYGSQGVATPGHFQGVMFEAAVGVPMVHVPYKGGIPMIVDLVAGRVDLGFNTYSATREHVRSGKLKYLAVTSETRRVELPNVPTLAELGVRGVELDAWFGLFVPAKTPDQVIEKLREEFTRVARTPDLIKRLNDEGIEVRTNTPAQFRSLIAADAERLGAAARRFGIKAD